MKPRKTSAAVSRHDPEPLYRQIAQRLVDIVIANNYLQADPPFVIVISG